MFVSDFLFEWIKNWLFTNDLICKICCKYVYGYGVRMYLPHDNILNVGEIANKLIENTVY